MRLRNRVDEFKAAGIDIAVISSQSAEDAKKGAEKYKLPFPVLLDSDLKLVDALGIRHVGAGPGKTDIGYASAFLVAADGKVVWEFQASDVRSRATPDEILAAAK